MWFLIWLIPLSLILTLLTWLLIAPVQLRVDTIRDLYDVRIVAILRARLLWDGERVRLKLRVFSIPVRMGRKTKREEKPKERKKKKKRRGRPSMSTIFKYMGAVMRTFRIKQFWMELDTDDYALNAQLYGLAYTLQRWGMNVQINFEGRSELVMEIENRAGRILWALIKTKVKSITLNTRKNGNES